MNEWQDISTAPKNGHDILICYRGDCVRVCFWDVARGGVWSLWPGREPVEPSYWMPLPAAPSEARS